MKGVNIMVRIVAIVCTLSVLLSDLGHSDPTFHVFICSVLGIGTSTSHIG